MFFFSCDTYRANIGGLFWIRDVVSRHFFYECRRKATRDVNWRASIKWTDYQTQRKMADRADVKILIIDDEPFIRESLAGFLEDGDYCVSSADSAEQAMNLLQKDPYDIAIVDLRLPGMNGDAFIQEVDQLVPGIRFLIHTGSVDYRLSNELLAVGIKPEHVFYKPQHDLTHFVDTIELLLKERSA